MMELQPVIKDQYKTAQVYYLSIVGMLVFESLLQVPSFLADLRHKGRSQPNKESSKRSSLTVAIHNLRTLPPLFPSFLTTHRLTTLFRLLIFIALNVLFSWARLRFSGDFKRSGWLCIANGGLALLISPRGTNLLSIVLRIPTDTLLIYHRWCGRATVIHGIIHFALNTRLYIRTEQLGTVFKELRIQVGIVAFAILCIIFLTSLAFVRRKAYEVFFFVHFLFLVYVIGACIHAPHGPEFLLPGLGLWVVDRGLRFFSYFKTVGIRDVKSYDGGVTKFILEGVDAKKPGMIVWVQFPGVSWNWHPFTISPNISSDIEGDETSAVIAVRSLGGWTKSVQMLADARSNDGELSSMTKVRIDGPYGVGKTNWGSQPVAVLVAGGIGITPAIGIAAHIIRHARPRAAESGGGELHIHLLWVLKEKTHIAWFAKEIASLARKASKTNVTLDITIHITSGDLHLAPGSRNSEIELMPSHEDVDMIMLGQGVWTTVSGRPNLTEWFTQVKSKRPGYGGAVHVCGPRSLVLDTRKAAVKASSRTGIFHVEEEVFEV